MKFSITADGLELLGQFFQSFPEVASKAMSIAINDVARDTFINAARDEMYKQVAFPQGYLDDPDKLQVTQFSTPTQLEAVITGRQRPTSMARFAIDAPGPGARTPPGVPIRVAVKPGDEKPIYGAFLVSLKSGNIGFAIRLRPGETLTGRREKTAVQLSPNVYLLYGPSVDQMLVSVSHEIEPEIQDALRVEFTRQFARLVPAANA